MVEMLTCMAAFAVSTQVLVCAFGAPYVLAAGLSAIALLIVEVLPPPLNVFKWRDLGFGLLGIVVGLYLSGWRP